jgi:hypothetical protein
MGVDFLAAKREAQGENSNCCAAPTGRRGWLEHNFAGTSDAGMAALAAGDQISQRLPA